MYERAAGPARRAVSGDPDLLLNAQKQFESSRTAVRSARAADGHHPAKRSRDVRFQALAWMVNGYTLPDDRASVYVAPITRTWPTAAPRPLRRVARDRGAESSRASFIQATASRGTAISASQWSAAYSCCRGSGNSRWALNSGPRATHRTGSSSIDSAGFKFFGRERERTPGTRSTALIPHNHAHAAK